MFEHAFTERLTVSIKHGSEFSITDSVSRQNVKIHRVVSLYSSN